LYTGWPAKHFWAFVVWNFEAKQVEILEITQVTIQIAFTSIAGVAGAMPQGPKVRGTCLQLPSTDWNGRRNARPVGYRPVRLDGGKRHLRLELVRSLLLFFEANMPK
jgi:hypothetical protein